MGPWQSWPGRRKQAPGPRTSCAGSSPQRRREEVVLPELRDGAAEDTDLQNSSFRAVATLGSPGSFTPHSGIPPTDTVRTPTLPIKQRSLGSPTVLDLKEGVRHPTCRAGLIKKAVSLVCSLGPRCHLSWWPWACRLWHLPVTAAAARSHEGLRLPWPRGDTPSPLAAERQALPR